MGLWNFLGSTAEGQLAAMGKVKAIIEFDPEGTILHANEIFLKLMGYSLRELRGKHHSIFVDPSVRGSNTPSGGIYSAFRYHDIVDVVLEPGTYRIAGVGGDTTQNSPDNLKRNFGITIGDSWAENNPQPLNPLTYPDQFNEGGPNLPLSGPNFLAFPEPSASMLLAAGGVMLFSRRRRRQA